MALKLPSWEIKPKTVILPSTVKQPALSIVKTTKQYELGYKPLTQEEKLETVYQKMPWLRPEPKKTIKEIVSYLAKPKFKELGQAFVKAPVDVGTEILSTARGIIHSGIELPLSFPLEIAQTLGVSKTGKINIPVIGEINSLKNQWDRWQAISPSPAVAALGFGSENIIKAAIFYNFVKTGAGLTSDVAKIIKARNDATNLSYKNLGLNKNATDQQIKSAYRELAQKYHPDKPGGNVEMFKKINQSYSFLQNRNISTESILKAQQQTSPENIVNVVKKDPELMKQLANISGEGVVPTIIPPPIYSLGKIMPEVPVSKWGPQPVPPKPTPTTIPPIPAITPPVAKTVEPLAREARIAAENTPGVKILPEGIELDIARFQKAEQFGAPSIRTGVFYLPELKSPYAKYYSTGKYGYGGGELITGRTTLRNPITVKAGTGGIGVKRAYDIIKGKGAYEKMRSEVLEKAWGEFPERKPDVNAIRGLLKKYGGNPELADDIIYFSKTGNLLPYAIQEHIAANAVRKAGYDSVLSYSTAVGKPRLSEVFDVRAMEYPTKGMKFEYPDFYNQAVKGVEEVKPEIPIKPPVPPTVKPTARKEEFLGGRPETEAVVKFRDKISKAGLVEKISRLREQAEHLRLAVKYGGNAKIGRLIQEETILKMVEQGEIIAARKAFAEGKKTGIIEQKSLFNEFIAKAKTRKEFSKVVSDVKKAINKLDIKHLRPEFRKNAEGIIADLDLVKINPRTTKLLVSRLHEVEQNPDNQIPKEKIEELKRLDKKALSDLTLEDLQNIKDTIGHLIKLNQLKNKLIFGNKLKEVKEVADESIVNINKKKVAEKSDPNIIDTTDRVKKSSLLRNIFTVDSYNAELLTEILDRNKHGIIKEVIYDGINNGVSKQLSLQQEAEDWIKDEFIKVGIDPTGKEFLGWSKSFNKISKNVDYQVIKLPNNRTIKLTKGERVSFILHSLNDKNLAHLLNGGFRYTSNLNVKHNLSAEDIEEIVNSATEKEKAVAEIFNKFFNEIQKEKLNEVSVDLNGWEVAREPDYYPIRTISIDRARDATKLLGNFTQQSLEGMGILKERINAKNALIIEDVFEVVYKHIKKTSAYIGLASKLRNAKMLILNNGFESSVKSVYGDKYYNALKDYLKDIEGDSINTNNVEKLVTELINKLDVAILGGINFGVMLKQPVSYLMAMTEMNAKYLSKAIPTKVNTDEISKYSPELRDRLTGNVSREMGELGQVGAVRKFFTNKTAFSQKLMVGIKKFDYATIGRIWNAVKLEVKDTHPTLTGDEYMKAVAKRAEEVIRLTQPTFHMKDRSAIGRNKNVFIRLLTKYTSQRNKNFNAIRRAILEYDISDKGAKAKSKLMGKLFLITVITSLMIEGINELTRIVTGRKKKSLLAHAVSVVGNSISYVYFVGDAFNSLISKINAGGFGGWDMSNPVSSFLDDTIDGIASGVNTIDQAMSGEEYKSGAKKGKAKWETSFINFIESSISTVSKLKGIPYDSAKKWLMGSYSLITGREEETKPSGKFPTKLPSLPKLPKLSKPKLPILPKLK